MITDPLFGKVLSLADYSSLRNLLATWFQKLTSIKLLLTGLLLELSTAATSSTTSASLPLENIFLIMSDILSKLLAYKSWLSTIFYFLMTLLTFPLASLLSSYNSDVTCFFSSTKNLNTISLSWLSFKLYRNACLEASHLQVYSFDHGGSVKVP